MNFFKGLVVIILIGCAYNMFKFGGSPESLMKDACDCYSDAKKLNNTDGMVEKINECHKYISASQEKLREMAKEEDWTDEKVNRITNELSQKYDCIR